jgi:ABC-type metal ion transport system substrate-binding protein
LGTALDIGENPRKLANRQAEAVTLEDDMRDYRSALALSDDLSERRPHNGGPAASEQ